MRWMLVFLVACGTDVATPDAQPAWSCRVFRDCAGSAVVTTSTADGSSAIAAETALADACEAEACSGALACHAICAQ